MSSSRPTGTKRQGETAPKPRPVTTPWGKAERRLAVTVAQRAGEQRYTIVAELLETTKGEALVRLAYSSDGRTRRGPVTLRRADIERLRTALEKQPELREVVLGTA